MNNSLTLSQQPSLNVAITHDVSADLFNPLSLFYPIL